MSEGPAELDGWGKKEGREKGGREGEGEKGKGREGTELKETRPIKTKLNVNIVKSVNISTCSTRTGR